MAKVQTASFELQIQYYISLLNVKFVLQKIVATAGGIYLFMNAFLYKKSYTCVINSQLPSLKFVKWKWILNLKLWWMMMQHFFGRKMDKNIFKLRNDLYSMNSLEKIN